MAIVVTKPTSQVGDTSALSVFSMAPTFLPTANSKIVVIAHASGTVTGSVSGTGTRFTQLARFDPQATGASFLLCDMDVPAVPTSVSCNVDYTGDAATGCTAVAVQLAGVGAGVVARQVLSVSSVAPNPVVTFPQAVASGHGIVVGIAAPGALCIFTPPAGWTSITASYGTPATGLGVFHAVNVGGLTFTFSTGAQADLAYVAAEYFFDPGIIDPMGMDGMFGV